MTFPVLSAGTSAYNLQRSLRFRSSASAYLNRTPASASNRRTWTWSAWVKRGTFANNYPALFSAGADVNNFNELRFTDLNSGVFDFTFVTGGADTARITTTPVYRDPSAWYHVVVALDTTQATAANRVKIYVNGVQVTSLTTATYPTQNSTWYVNAANAHGLGATVAVGRYFDGYLTEVNFIDGQALTPSSFGSTNAVTGVWQPAKYTGTYGTNGFYLPFTNTTSTTTLGNDFSGNGNNWTTNNISLTPGVTYDSMTDVPTLTSPTAANFAVLNPLSYRSSLSNTPPTNGNLTCTSDTNTRFFTATMASSGSYYFEVTATNIGTGNGISVRLWRSGDSEGAIVSAMLYTSAGEVFVAGTLFATVATYTTGDVIALAHNTTAGTVGVYKNNSLQTTATGVTTSNPTWPGCAVGTNAVANFNFGQRPFAYTPPSGFVALNTFNLPSSTIPNGANFMAATLYTGTGATLSVSNAVNGVGFQPDFVWFKSRSGAFNHLEVDSIRGLNKYLYPNLVDAEGTFPVLDSVNSSGFVINASIGTPANNSGSTYVAWNWKAGGAGVTNTAGSITSTVSANTTSGFSVVTYTGTGSTATVGHGLGVAPSMLIVKRRNSTGDWGVYHASLSANGAVFLNLTDAYSTPGPWNNTAPTSSQFTIATGSFLNTNGGTYVAYCFAPIAGYSAVGSYTGNGSADGPFIYTGFRPRYILIKNSSAVEDWYISDTSRDPYNQSNTALFADLSNAEAVNSARGIDFLSNGFKLRGISSANNASGNTYIYAAFAENPFRNALAR